MMLLLSKRMILYCPYRKNEVLFSQSISGTYYIEVETKGMYEISVVGGGGGGTGTISSNSSASSAGASGSGFVGVIKLEKGVYSITVGAGGVGKSQLDATLYGGVGETSSFLLNDTALISSPGGGGGHSWWRSGASYATPGVLPTINTDVMSVSINAQGVTGAIMSNPGYGGSSVLEGTTYGKGGDAHRNGSYTTAYSGNDGYVQIVFKGV